jgi:hypothetical protein
LTSETLNCRNNDDCHKKNHICQVVIQKDFGRVKEMVKDAKFYCKNCGRAASEEANLCNPSKI